MNKHSMAPSYGMAHTCYSLDETPNSHHKAREPKAPKAYLKEEVPQDPFRFHNGVWECFNRIRGWEEVTDRAMRASLVHRANPANQVDPEFPFRILGGKYERYHSGLMEWVAMATGHLQVWLVDGRKRSMSTRKVLWILTNGQLPPGMEVVYINGLPEDRLDNLRLMSKSENRKNVGKVKQNPRVKLLAHRKELILLLPSTANFAFFAERWGCHKNTLLNLRSKHFHQ